MHYYPTNMRFGLDSAMELTFLSTGEFIMIVFLVLKNVFLINISANVLLQNY